MDAYQEIWDEKYDKNWSPLLIFYILKMFPSALFYLGMFFFIHVAFSKFIYYKPGGHNDHQVNNMIGPSEELVVQALALHTYIYFHLCGYK